MTRWKPTPEEAMGYMFEAVVYQNIDLTGPWKGWKIRGPHLVAPDKERIPVRELVGLLIHYRAKFGHHRPQPQSDAAQPSNVVPFARAAVVQLEARQKAAGAGV